MPFRRRQNELTQPPPHAFHSIERGLYCVIKWKTTMTVGSLRHVAATLADGAHAIIVTMPAMTRPTCGDKHECPRRRVNGGTLDLHIDYINRFQDNTCAARNSHDISYKIHNLRSISNRNRHEASTVQITRYILDYSLTIYAASKAIDCHCSLHQAIVAAQYVASKYLQAKCMHISA